ncbi:hypothetical protein UM93_07780 [Psychromicrobium lacuslunae]|uniref:Uncharacterized protein n=1 Tax=Psychromicrobium lacuslunae TaxID=1618207 RepID=A0A0D4BYA0_9MICC|nr:hypothetical protein UM93_07780 [Psychromicrobium lacuslunae]
MLAAPTGLVDPIALVDPIGVAGPIGLVDPTVTELVAPPAGLAESVRSALSQANEQVGQQRVLGSNRT